MAITAQTDVQIATKAALTLPAMAKQPLLNALENLNYLWQWHRPPVADVCPNPIAAVNEPYIIPVMPSEDGLPYTFEHRVMPFGTGTLTITVEYHTSPAFTGAWSALYVSTAPATSGNLITKVDADKLIPASAVALRVTYTVA